MKRLFVFPAAALAVFLLLGCGAAAKEIQARSQSERSGVFVEVKDGDALSAGSAELTIKAHIKTHVEGYYALESKESLHGKEKYLFLVNIDGQAARWEVNGVEDVKPAYDADGKTSRDPEAREGIKYMLEKKIRLKAGPHKVFLGLPGDDYAVEAEISLKDGEAATLEFKPVYRNAGRPVRRPTFLKGLYRYEVFLDDKPI